MFYKEEDISNELICPKCSNRFDDPRILPCGNCLCQSCIKVDIDNENKTMKKCFYCQEKHSLPKEGEFAKNKLIIKLLEKKPIEVKRGALGEQFKKSMMEIIEKKQELEMFMKSREQIVSDYLSEIRNQIDLITETRIESLNKARESQLEKLKQYQTECMFSKRTNQIECFTKLNEISEKMRIYLNGTDWNENCVNEQMKEAKNIVDLCSKAKVNFEHEIFLNKKPVFIPSTMTLYEAETIGELNFEDIGIKENQNLYVSINQNKKKFLDMNVFIWISNISITKSKLTKKFDSIYNLNDPNSFILINNNVKLSDSILTFYKDGRNFGNYFDNYDKQFVVDSEFYNNFLFLKCRDWVNNMHLFMTQFENNKWSGFLEGGGSSTLLNQFHTMAANGCYLYCFYNTQVFPYEYKPNIITRKEKLPFTLIGAKDGCKIKVDRKFFYVVSDIYDEISVYIHNLFNGIITKVISKFNIIDICLIEKGLLVGLYFENYNLVINVFAEGDGQVLMKKNITYFSENDKNVLKKLKLVSFSKESQVILDQYNSIVYWNHLPIN